MLAVPWLLGSGLAWACPNEGALFKDDFDRLQTAQWTTDGRPSVFSGHLSLRPEAAKTNSIYTVRTFPDVEICGDVRLVYSRDVARSYVGIAFWVENFSNLYTFQITLDGYAGVFHLADDKWTTVIDDRQVEAVNTEKLAFNELRVVTRGTTATLYINGQKFDEITGEPPEEQHVGFMAESPKGVQPTYEMDDLVVRPAQ
jgi:hypothetical protein